MPRYIKKDHIIFASKFAYETIYKGQGYLPVKEEDTDNVKDLEAEYEQEQVVPKNATLETDDDDYSEDIIIDPNDNVPLAARVAMLSYDELKAKAKELGIPKYANTKREELVNLIVEKMETEDD